MINSFMIGGTPVEIIKLINALPGAVSQGLIWGLMAIGVYITFKILELSDLTVDGSMVTGMAVCAMLMVYALVMTTRIFMGL